MTFLSSNVRLPSYRWKGDVPGQLYDTFRVAATHTDGKMILTDPAVALSGTALVSGTTAAVSAPDGSGYVTVTGLATLMTANDVGRYLTISGAGGSTDGRFYITEFVTSSSVKVSNRNGSANAGPLSWKVTVEGWDLSASDRVVRAVPELQGGSSAFIPSVGGGLVTIVGLHGMTSSSVGKYITLSTGGFASNRGAFQITTVINPGSVQATNPVGVIDNSTPYSWSVRDASRMVANGVWVVGSGAWTRATDANTGALIKDAVVEVLYPTTTGTRLYASGNTATISAVTPGVDFTLTGLTGMTANLVGQDLRVDGAANGGNIGSFPISAFISATSVTCTNAGGVFPDANSGNIRWSVFQQGTTATVASVLAGVATITGLNGMDTSTVGNYLELSGAADPRNNGQFRITQLISATSVKIASPFAVSPDNPTNWTEYGARDLSIRAALFAPKGVDLVVGTDPQQWLVLVPNLQATVFAVAATNVNVPTRAGFLDVDGRPTGDGDIVLLLGQSTATQNGLYTVRAGLWEPYALADNVSYSTPLSQLFITQVNCGSMFQGSEWVLSSPTTSPIVPGVDVQNWFLVGAADTDQPGPIRVDANFGDSFQTQTVGSLGVAQNLLTITLPPIVPGSAGKKVSVGSSVNFKVASCGCNIVQILAQPAGTDSVDTQAPGTLGWYWDLTGSQFDLESDGVSRWRSAGGGITIMLTGWTAPDIFTSTSYPLLPSLP
jgi:hypothetical protein